MPKNSALLPLVLTCFALIGCGSNTDNGKGSNNLLPDLVESTPTVSGTLAAGSSITVGETATNAGSANASTSSTQFYLNSNAAKGGTLLGARAVPALAAGAASSGSTPLTLPLNLNGNYYLVACANDTGTVVETSPTNNCNAAAITVQSAILAESGVSVSGTLAPGGSITVSDTTTDTGVGKAATSLSRFYLNTNAVEGGTLLGSRSVPALAAGAASTVTTPLSLPSDSKGAYYMVACADDDGSVSESSTTNRCAAVALTVLTADLAESAVIPAAGVAGKTLQVSDTVTNLAGSVSAGASSTQFYLNTSASKGGTPLVSRSVPALAAGKSSTALTMLTLPATANGQNYLIVCANDTNSVVESNSANNCAISPLQVFQAPNSVFVDVSDATAADGPACGAFIGGVTNAPCKTIAGGIASATGNSFTAVFLADGTTYNEQVTILNQLTLGALGAGATIQAPPGPLTADSDNLESFITVVSGASAVITNLTVEGPINNTSCGDLMYGIFVKTASATVAANVILNIVTANTAGLGGCQSGIGVRFGSKALGYAASGSILSNTVSGYQKGGIVVDGPGTNVSVTGNVVAGSTWAFGVIAQNGIQISRGALGNASANVVSNNSYGNNYCADIADGILLYDLAPGLIVTKNQVTGNDEGIGVYSDSPNTATNAAITSNTVYSNLLLGIHIDANSTGSDVWLNTIYLNADYDEVDETGSFTLANDWGTTDPAHANILGNGGGYNQKAGSLCH